MKKTLLILLFSVSCLITNPILGHNVPSKSNINNDWLFHLGEVKNAEQVTFSDEAWRKLDLPHDWTIEHDYEQNAAQKDNGGYAIGGIGWYRKHIKITSKDLLNHTIYLNFDAAYMNSEVWVNGRYFGKRPYGYISFGYDITKALHKGDNVIAVRIDNSLEPSARWYHGCGIYADVHLVIKNKTHFEKWGTFITTPEIGDHYAEINVKTAINNMDNEKDAIIESTIDSMELNGKKTPVNSGVYIKHIKLEANTNSEYQYKLALNNPQRWDVISPVLYNVSIKVKDVDGKIIDSQNIRIGLRTLKWDTATGFYLNGRQFKIHGMCEHLEGGPIGAAYNKQMLRWKIRQLQEMGCNAIRTAHNPQIPVFYDLCDEMGMLVLDEAFDGWSKKADEDYGKQAFAKWWKQDLTDMIRRDRNHPSIFLYSVGNETRGSIAPELVKTCHETDPTRLVTSGDSERAEMDVSGFNGASEKKPFFENYNPSVINSYNPVKHPFIGTEAPHTFSMRGFYRSMTWYRNGYPSEKQQPFYIPSLTPKEIFKYYWIDPAERGNHKQVFNSCYDNATVRITVRQSMAYNRDLPWYTGSFRWVGFDYRGEAGFEHGGWPFRAFMGGALDLAGFRKDNFYLYQSEWTKKPMVHLLPSWTHPYMKKGTEIPVWAYTNCDYVELFFNGESLGRKSKGQAWDSLQCQWMVPWNPGKLLAVAYRDGYEVARDSISTSAEPSNLALTLEDTKATSTKGDIALVTIDETDSNGVLYPYGENMVHTVISGPAFMRAFENGNPVDTTINYMSNEKRAFFGQTRAFIQFDDDSKKPVSLLAAAICGDKTLKISNKISIATSDIAIRGRLAKRNIKVYYILKSNTSNEQNLDSLNIKSMKLYKEPFEVEDGTTVVAYVYDGRKLLFKMLERFGEGEGIYWEK